MMRGIMAAMALGAFISDQAVAEELSGTLRKIKDTGAITLGYRESSVPFSYLDDKQQPIGYSLDICDKIVAEVQKRLKIEKLDVKYNPVTSATRIPLIANGTIDLECGSTNNTAERQRQVWYTNTHFLTATRYVTKRSANITKIEDLKGKTVVSTAGTTNIREVTEANVTMNLNLNIVSARDHSEAFLMVETDRASAFVMDDILLAGFVSLSKDPSSYAISSDSFSQPAPYGIMLRRGDVEFKKIADSATAALYVSAEGKGLYAKWFLQPIPPRGLNLNVPMSEQMERVFKKPTDSSDPSAY